MNLLKKIFKWVIYSVIGILVALCCYVLITTGIMKMDYANIFGYTYFQVKTGSMGNVIDVGDIVIVKLGNDYKEDDIITYKSGGEFITHRLIDIKEDKLITKGDVNNVVDDPIVKKQVIGKVSMIISTSLCLKILGMAIIVLIILTLLNFDTVFEKYIIADKQSKKKSKVTGDTTYIPIEEIIKLQNEQEEKKNIKKDNIDDATVEFLDDFTLELKEAEIITMKEQEFLSQVLEVLKLKNKKIKKSKFNKEWSIKFCYLYKVMNLFLLDEQKELAEVISNPTFEELYNYDFEKIGLSKKIQNNLYDMPFYVFAKLLITCMIYDDSEFFDAIFKIFKYRVKIDKNYVFTSLKKKTKKHKEQELKLVKEQLEFMNVFSLRFDKKNLLELESIKEYIKINSKIQ